MKNFDYLQQCGMLRLHGLCAAAEDNQVNHPDLSAISARRALEYVVKSIYAMKHIPISEKASLFELVDGEPFRGFIGDDHVMMAVHYVRKVGNAAAHMKTAAVNTAEALSAVYDRIRFPEGRLGAALFI